MLSGMNWTYIRITCLLLALLGSRDLETRPPVKIQEVEEMQKEIIRVARALAEEGRMIMERGKQGYAFL